MRVLILGGYGFIGAEIMRACMEAGFECVGLGRSAKTGQRLVPGAEWIGADMASLDAAGKWAAHLAGVDAVVNAAGALQDGPRDRLSAIHQTAVVACLEALEEAGARLFVQVSAVGAAVSASTQFMSSKAHGDAAVKASPLEWVILRPGLVIGRSAYGGTALLRVLAGFPLMTPLVHASSRVQTVAVDEVADAVVAALRGEIASRRVYDLVEEEPHALRDIVRGFRRQFGFAPARIEPDLPRWVAAAAGALGDVAGLLGWRTALRSTAMKVMGEEVLGDPAPYRRASGKSLRPFDKSVALVSATAQERLFARAGLVLPLMIVSLAAFWILSGAIGLVSIGKAAPHLYDLAGAGLAKALVVAGSFLDIAIGAALLHRRTSRIAAIASAAVGAFYLAAGTLTEPALWLDPFGALAKIIPIAAMGLAVALLLEER